MSFVQPWLEADFGSAYSGLATVGFRLYKIDGTNSVARTIIGVVDISGNGSYGVANVSVPDNCVGIEWDTGGVSPVYVTENLEPYRNRISLSVIRGLLHDKALIDEVVENGYENVLTARLRIYDSKTNQEAAEASSPIGGTTGLIATYTIRATYDGKKLNTYVVVPE